MTVFLLGLSLKLLNLPNEIFPIPGNYRKIVLTGFLNN
jgi:hypothetical protein